MMSGSAVPICEGLIYTPVEFVPSLHTKNKKMKCGLKSLGTTRYLIFNYFNKKT